jgi:hypothetical protein
MVEQQRVASFRLGPFLGLLVIAVGSGGIKPCVSTFGADQVAASNVEKHDALTLTSSPVLTLEAKSWSNVYCLLFSNDSWFTHVNDYHPFT